MVVPTPVMRIQGSSVVELTNTLDELTKIGNKCAHNNVLLFGSTPRAHRERR